MKRDSYVSTKAGPEACGVRPCSAEGDGTSTSRGGSAQRLETVEKVVRRSGRHLAYWSDLLGRFVICPQTPCKACDSQ